VRSLDQHALEAALHAAGFDTRVNPDGALRVQATAEQVGRVAASSHQVLLELHEGDSTGLEELFFQLTASGATTSDDASVAAA
jgi:ABC-2 type transport system ATP-binding protein